VQSPRERGRSIQLIVARSGSGAGAERERSGSVLENGSVGSVIFQKSLGAERLGSVYYICIYILYILHLYSTKACKKTLVAKYMKTCIFVLIDEYYIIMKFKIPSIVY
jgi:hypothetical protein